VNIHFDPLCERSAGKVLKGLFLQAGVDVLAAVDKAAHGSNRVREHLLLVCIEGDLDNALDTAGADNDGNADVEVFPLPIL
jgi:hypothetical protein